MNIALIFSMHKKYIIIKNNFQMQNSTERKEINFNVKKEIIFKCYEKI